MNREVRQLGNLVVWFTAIGMALLLGLIIFALIRGGPSNEDIVERLDTIERQLTYVSCLMVLEEQTPEGVAECQLP